MSTRRRSATPAGSLGLVVVWVALWLVVKNRDTLELPFAQTTGLHTLAQRLPRLHRRVGPVQLVHEVRHRRDQCGPQRDHHRPADLLSTAVFPRPVPEIGWLGSWPSSDGSPTPSRGSARRFSSWSAPSSSASSASGSSASTCSSSPSSRSSSASSDCRSASSARATSGCRRSSPRARPHADHAVVRLPHPDGALLRHRPGVRRRRHPCLRHPRWCGSPSTASSPSRPTPSRPLAASA